MMSDTAGLSIHIAHPDEYRQLANILHRAVHAIDPAIYSSAQQHAWAPTPPDYEMWQARMQNQLSFVAKFEDKPVAFMEYTPLPHDEQKDCAYIDCTYCLPDYQGQGITSQLYDHLTAHAQKQKIKFLKVDASLTAVHFFEKKGFTRQQQNKIQRAGETLINYRMSKAI